MLAILEQANSAFLEKKYLKSLSLYEIFWQLNPESSKHFEAQKNILSRLNANSDFNNEFLYLVAPIYNNTKLRNSFLDKFVNSIQNDYSIKIIDGKESCILLKINLACKKDNNQKNKAIFDFFKNSGLFDESFYIEQYAGKIKRESPLEDFIMEGIAAGRLPANWFDITSEDNYEKLLSMEDDAEDLKQIPLVSIVVPTYNNHEYLRDCYDSIVNQTLENIEIIIVNDGSTEKESLEIFEEYANKDKRIRIINKKNTGYGHSVNCGMYAARGKYIGIVESDDFCDETMFEKLYKTAEKYNCEIVKCNYKTFIGDLDRKFENVRIDRRKEKYNKIVDPLKDPDLLRAPNIVINQPSITRKDFLDKYDIKFRETPGASFQDVGVFWKRYFYAHRIYYIEDYLYFLRRDNPDSSSVNKGKVLAHTREYAWIEEELRNNPQIKDKFIRYFHNKKLGSTEWHLTRVDPAKAYMLEDYIVAEYAKALQLNEIDRDLIGKARIEKYENLLAQSMDKRKSAVIYIKNLWKGGLERSACLLSQALGELDYDVTFLVNEKSMEPDYPYFGEIKIFELKEDAIDILERSSFIFDFKFKQPHHKDKFVEYCIKNYTNKYIPTIHNTRDRTRFYYDAIKKYLDRFQIEPSQLRKIVCCGENVRRDLIDRYGDFHNTDVLYNCVHTIDIDETIKLPCDKYVLFAGRKSATMVKGLDVLIKAYTRSSLNIHGIKLLIIGEGELEPELVKIVGRYGLQDMVLSVPFSKNIENYYKNAICLVLPSRYEGFSMTIIEALAYGTPVIASNVGGADEVIRHSFNGYLFENEDDKALAYYLDTIPYTYRQLKRNCVESVEKFSFENYKLNLQKIIE